MRAPLSLVLVSLVCGCGPTKGGGGPTPPASEDPACPAGPELTASPIDLEQVDEVFGMGMFGAPGHVIPNEHAGIWVKGTGVPLHAPAAGRITALRRTRYLKSPWREGEADHAISFRACETRDSVFGHVTTLSADLEVLLNSDGCVTYSTDTETVEACSVPVSVKVAAGQVIGTVGGKSARGVDWGHHDDTRTNHFANPARVTPFALHSVCPYESLDEGLRAGLYGKLKRTGQPRCGTVELDVDGTAQGLWMDAAHQGTQGADESAFVTLGPQYDTPDTTLRLAVAPAALGGLQVDVPTSHAGRKNRSFSEITSDGLVYCYSPQDSDASLFLSLAASGELRMERVTHAVGSSPCDGDPAGWTLTSAAMTLVR